MIDEPVICLTSDVDWASDSCIEFFIKYILQYDVKPTFFTTHRSVLLDEYLENGVADVGLHPNFMRSSTHGNTYDEIIDHICGLYPGARCFRSHAFFDNDQIVSAMAKRGILYDSNSCQLLQPEIVPVLHSSGITRFPVFWGDGPESILATQSISFKTLKEKFLSPGLKVLDVHPFNFCMNVPTADFYRKIKHLCTDMTKENILRLSYKGIGCRSILLSLFDFFKYEGLVFKTLEEVYCDYPITDGADKIAVRRI